MLSLAPLKYRNVLATEGGPIARIEFADCSIAGGTASEARAYLKDELIPGFQPVDPDGAGTHKSPLVARFMAISEAIERWALRALVASGKTDAYGLDVDITSNGMAAFPGLFDFQARKRALGEAIERHCLISWWEGILPTVPLAFPGLQERGIEIVNPYSRHSVALVWKLCDNTFYSFAFGYGDNVEKAVWRAGIELQRTEENLRQYYEENPEPSLAEILDIKDLLLKRAVYFSTREGFKQFLEKLKNTPECPPKQKPKTVFDGKIPGPWNQYATVWRVVFEPPTRRHLTDAHDYFFW